MSTDKRLRVSTSLGFRSGLCVVVNALFFAKSAAIGLVSLKQLSMTTILFFFVFFFAVIKISKLLFMYSFRSIQCVERGLQNNGMSYFCELHKQTNK